MIFSFLHKWGFISFIFTIGVVFFIGCTTEKKESSLTFKDRPDVKVVELSLPINGLEVNKSTKSRVHLLVSIPQNFCSVYPLEVVMNGNMSEFIPKSDKDVNSWTEIITIHKYIGKSFSASKVADHIKKAVIQHGLDVKVLESNNKEYENYSESSFLITYATKKGRPEIVYGKYYSGPYDCCGFQYAIALNQYMNEQKAKNKIKEFVENKTDIIKF